MHDLMGIQCHCNIHIVNEKYPVTLTSIAYATFVRRNEPRIGLIILEANQGVPATDIAKRTGKKAFTSAYAATIHARSCQ